MKNVASAILCAGGAFFAAGSAIAATQTFEFELVEARQSPVPSLADFFTTLGIAEVDTVTVRFAYDPDQTPLSTSTFSNGGSQTNFTRWSYTEYSILLGDFVIDLSPSLSGDYFQISDSVSEGTINVVDGFSIVASTDRTILPGVDVSFSRLVFDNQDIFALDGNDFPSLDFFSDPGTQLFEFRIELSLYDGEALTNRAYLFSYSQDYQVNEVATVPLPAGILLLGAGLGALAIGRKGTRTKQSG